MSGKTRRSVRTTVAAAAVAALSLVGASGAGASGSTAWGSAQTTSWSQLASWFNTPKYPPDSRYTAPAAGAGLQPQSAAATSDGGSDSWVRAPNNPGLGGIVSEVRFGALIHDTGPISSSTEDGIDINAEVLFTSPEIFKYILWARPHIGGSLNTEGDTSQVYAGLTWTADIYENFFVEFSFGGTYHDGSLVETTERNGLGCEILFRESISAGVIFGGQHSLSVMFDHISNGGLCDDNDGQDTLGVRYGYRF